jgi:hypothetical protein
MDEGADGGDGGAEASADAAGVPDDERPSWWAENERLREEMSLPPYEPSRFEDGTYTYRVVERIEAEHDCTVRFVAVDPRYPDGWEVRADGERLFPIGRRRDEHGNTVYEMAADEFERAVADALG